MDVESSSGCRVGVAMEAWLRTWRRGEGGGKEREKDVVIPIANVVIARETPSRMQYS